jgi:membrane associated rhomboid family serine protease
VKKLLIANAVIWLLSVLTVRAGFPEIYELLALRPADVLGAGWVWQLATYMWLHSASDFMHILLNSLFLWMFGGSLEQMWGGRAFLKFYLICGVSAGVVVLVSGWWLSPGASTVGASGAVYGLVAAWALVLPRRLVYLFGVLPIKGWVFAVIPIGFALLEFITGSTSGVSHAAHLGGLATGALLVTGYWRPSRLFALWQRRKRRRHLRSVSRDERRPPPGGGYWN